MKRNISLSQRIFRYLLGVTAFSLATFGFFWTEGKLSDYKKEVIDLKKNFSESKKAEIKNKILQVKDYIYSIRNNPAGPINRVLTAEINKAAMAFRQRKKAGDPLKQSLQQCIQQAGAPLYVISADHKVLAAYSPFPASDGRQKEERATLLRELKNHGFQGEHSLPLYRHHEPGDSLLGGYITYSTLAIPGYTLASIVSGKNIEDILQRYILDSLSRVRYASDEYIFINTYAGKALVSNGKVNIPPVDILHKGSESWKKVFKIEQSAASYPGGLFYTYSWQKISVSKTATKTSYFSFLPVWNWIIGTGFYEDDVNSVIAARSDALYDDLQKKLLGVLALFLVSGVLSYLIVLFFAKKFRKNIQLFDTFFGKAARENVLIDKTLVDYTEFENIAEAANLMVAEREKVKTALLKSEESYRLLFEQNPVSMLIYDRHSLELLAVNEAFVSQYGYSAPEALQMRLPDLYPPEEKSLITELVDNLHGHVYVGEWHHIKKDGKIITIIATSNDLMHMGREARIAVVTDITERKLIEEQIQQLNQSLEERVADRTAQLVSINKELESFSYSISHDLRAPLRAIFGFSQILANRHRESLNDEGRQYMDYIVEASIRMEQLINDLLNYSRLGRKSVNIKQVSLSQVISDIQSDFNSKLQETGSNLIIDSDLPSIPGDESLLRQTFTNLIDNAITYRREGIPLVIKICCIPDSRGHLIKISDNGIGIPKEYWEKIFNIFQRLHSDDKYPGTGIGLATVRKAVSMLDGTVWVESEEGQGSTFFIYLPEHKSDTLHG